MPQGGGVLEAHARRDRLPALLRRGDVLGEGPAAVAGEQVGEDLVARAEARHAGAHRLDHARDIEADLRLPRRPQPHEEADEPGPRLEPSRSARLTDAARVRTSTSPSPGSGFSTPRISTTSGPPYRKRCAAFTRLVVGGAPKEPKEKEHSTGDHQDRGSAISIGRGIASESGSTRQQTRLRSEAPLCRRSTCSLPLPKPVQSSDGSPFHAPSTRYRAPSSNVKPHDAPLDAVTPRLGRGRDPVHCINLERPLMLSALDDGNAGRSTRIAVPVKMTSAFRLCWAGCQRGLRCMPARSTR